MKVVVIKIFELFYISRSHGEFPCFVTPPCDAHGTLARDMLEILLVKGAEQRSGSDIHPRIDRQLLGSDETFGHYETLRCTMVECILTAC